MSSIGKIFVILNLVLAVLVLGAAGALLKQRDIAKTDNEKLRVEVTEAKTALEQATSQFAARESQLTKDKQQAQEENDDLKVANQNLERSNQKSDLDSQQLRDDVTKITAKLDTLDAAMNTQLQRNTELNDKNEALRTEAMEAKAAANKAELAQHEAESQLAEAQRSGSSVKDELAAAQDKLNQSSKLLEVAKTSGFDATAVLAMPRIEAMVSEVDDKYGFVILDKGKLDSVERGFTFDVHRDGTYLGRVKVDDLYDHYATARIEVAAPGTKMQRADRASTYLN